MTATFPLFEYPVDLAPFALFSECRRYRYVLGRRLSGDPTRIIAFYMINPSDADEERPDPTITRCIGFGNALGCGGMLVANLSAYVDSEVKNLRHAVPGPIGTNDEAIQALALGGAALGALADHLRRPLPPSWRSARASIHVCGWGQLSKVGDRDVERYLRERAAKTLNMLRAHGATPQALKLNKDGSPGHPLYLSSKLRPFPMEAT